MLTPEQIREARLKLGAPPNTSKPPVQNSWDNIRFEPKSQPAQKDGGALETLDNVLKTGSDFLFGTTKKTLSELTNTAIDSAKYLAGDTSKADKVVKKKGESDVTPLNTAFTFLELYPGGGALTSAFKKLPGGEKVVEGLAKIFKYIPEKLREKAIKQYSAALNPTTKATKEMVKDVVPDLLDKGQVITSLEKMGAVTEKKVASFGSKIDDFYAALPEGTKAKVKPILNELEGAKAKNIIDGVDHYPEATKAITDIQERIAQHGEEVDVNFVRKIRQLYDGIAAKSNRAFTEEAASLKGMAAEQAGNAIRKELATDYPDLAKLNKEFTFWKDVDTIVQETLTRKTGQQGGIIKPMGTIVGAATGFQQGEGTSDKIQKTVIYGILGNQAIKFMRSPAWRTTSAVAKNRLANFIAKGDKKAIGILMKEIIAGGHNVNAGTNR